MNLTIRARIILLGVLATLSLFFIVGAASWIEYRDLSDKQLLLAQIGSEERLSDAIHELQRERGVSAGALARPTEPNFQALATQRTGTDNAVARLTQGETRGLEGLARLTQMRNQISHSQVTADASFDYYTNVINEILDRIVELSKGSDARVIKSDLYAHAHLMYAKEDLGEIRALLNEGFSLGTVDIARMVAVSRRLGRYHYHIRIFMNDAPAAVVGAYSSSATLPAMQTTLETINAVLSGRPEAWAGMTAERWFSMATSAIDALKSIEDQSIGLVKLRVDNEIGVATQRWVAISLMSLAVGAALIFLAATAVLRLLRALDIVISGVETVVGSSNFSYRIQLQSNDEMGIVARGFNQLLNIAERLIKEKGFFASHDPLTGAFNRYRLAELFASESLRDRRYDSGLTLVMFDIDHFKAINDKHGHAVGDTVLKETAVLMRDNIRATDVLARWGGEEFVILVPETYIEKGQALAEKLRGIIASHAFTGVPTSVTASFGVAEHVAAGETLDVLCARADRALYRAKHEGRNRVCVELLEPSATLTPA